MNINVSAPSVSVSIGGGSTSATIGVPVVKEYTERPAYEGTYEVTPSAEAQMLETKNFRMTENMVINPIPSNYGLITWNGATLTVS